MQDWTFSHPRQSDFFRSMSVLYMWDDHDYGPNNSDKHSPARDAALRSFLESVPYHKLPGYDMVDPVAVSLARTEAAAKGLDIQSSQELPPVYYAFTIGQGKTFFTMTFTTSDDVKTPSGCCEYFYLIYGYKSNAKPRLDPSLSLRFDELDIHWQY
jgi:hypothetical protein